MKDLFDSEERSYSQGLTDPDAQRDSKRDRWLLPGNWSTRCESCPRCGHRVVFLEVDGEKFAIDVDLAYKKKTAPKSCRVTSRHSTVCARYLREGLVIG